MTTEMFKIEDYFIWAYTKEQAQELYSKIIAAKKKFEKELDS